MCHSGFIAQAITEVNVRTGEIMTREMITISGDVGEAITEIIMAAQECSEDRNVVRLLLMEAARVYPDICKRVDEANLSRDTVG